MMHKQQSEKMVAIHIVTSLYVLTSAYFAIITVTFVLSLASCCQFSSFVQTNETVPARDWRTRIQEHFTRFRMRVTFVADQMTVWSNETKITRICLEQFTDGIKELFLVSHTEYHKYESGDNESPKIRYSCIQFIRRSDSILQLKSSSLIDRPDRALCKNISSTLSLDPWLIVDVVHLLSPTPSSQRHCSALLGGFSVRISGRSRRGEMPCDGSVLDEIRLETNCVVGVDLLTFFFRRSECSPPELFVNGSRGVSVRDAEWGSDRSGRGGGVRQSFMCLADWTERQYKFVLIRHDYLPYVWLLRTGTRLLALDESFTTFIFTDLVALTTNYVTDLDSAHLRLDVVRNIRRPVTSLCIDEDDIACGTASREACSTLGADGVPLALTCPRSCGVCNATRPTICSFPADWVGEWTDAWSGQKIAVNQTVIGFETSGTREFFHCVQWERPRPPPTPSSSSSSWGETVSSRSVDVLLVAGYTNGCRPRYLCARVLKKSTSVLYLRFSQTLTWPLTQSITSPIDCRLFVYDIDSTGPADDALRSKHFRLLYSRQPRQPVPCHLPNNLRNISVAFGDGGRCDSVSLIETNGKTGMVLTMLPGCRLAGLIPTNFDCIMSSRKSNFELPRGLEGFGLHGDDIKNQSRHASNFKITSAEDSTQWVDDLKLSSVSSDLIVTRSVPNHITGSAVHDSVRHVWEDVRFHCWIFVDNILAQGVIYLVDIAQCNETAKRDVIERRSTAPVARFWRPRSSSTGFMTAGRERGGEGGSEGFQTKYYSDVSVIEPPSRATTPAPTMSMLKRFLPDASMTSSSSSSSSLSNASHRGFSLATRRRSDGANGAAGVLSTDTNAFVVVTISSLLFLFHRHCSCCSGDTS